MMTVINGKKMANRPHSSGLWPLLRAIDMVAERKITQRATMISHQMNPTVPPFLSCTSGEAFRAARPANHPIGMKTGPARAVSRCSRPALMDDLFDGLGLGAAPVVARSLGGMLALWYTSGLPHRRPRGFSASAPRRLLRHLAELLSQALPVLEVDAPASEGVDSTPAPADVE